MIWLLPWEDNDEVRHMPWFTWALIAINVAVFILQTALGDEEVANLFRRYGLVADEWHWYQFFTGSFLHGDWLHLLGNMLFLWVFGDNVEDALGHAGFLVVYFVGGFAGDLLYVYANDFQIPSIGASGCISALAGAYALLFFERDIDLKLVDAQIKTSFETTTTLAAGTLVCEVQVVPLDRSGKPMQASEIVTNPSALCQARNAFLPEIVR